MTARKESANTNKSAGDHDAYYQASIDSRMPIVDMSLSFEKLSVHGYGSHLDYQKNFANYPLMYLNRLVGLIQRRKKNRIDILQDLEGLVEGGETLVVLGRPGSGCTTLLKTLVGETFGLNLSSESDINYGGLSPHDISGEFRGRGVYQAEIDVHFPHLTVRQTLEVAVKARQPREVMNDRDEAPREEAVAASLGLMKALDHKVGNDLVQGVSGGERKRTSIAEVLACDPWIQCWDNSTRGLDSATAFNFVSLIANMARKRKTVAVVSLYQASQDIYNLVDKVLLLYEGRQIFFGRATDAKTYFLNLGFVCPERSNDPDFLTSITKPAERCVRKGYENRVPRTADEFAATWQRSPERKILLEELDLWKSKMANEEHQNLLRYRALQNEQRAHSKESSSAYMIPLVSQIHLLLVRASRRLNQDLPALIGAIVGNMVISLILGSMFYNLSSDTASFLGRTVIIFFGVVLNSTVGAFEGTLLWEHRPIVEKHHRYGFYKPVAEAISSMVADVPNKIVMTIAVNTPYYFLANLRRTPEAFFTYLLFSFVAIVMGSMIWRAAGALSRTLSESQPVGAAFSTLLTMYTGFIIPVPMMKPWLRWFAYINPCFYMYESLLVNEFSNRLFECSSMIPQGPEYAGVGGRNSVCGVRGATIGSNVIDGDAYLAVSFQYFASHKWRNIGIMIALSVFFCVVYLWAAQYISLLKSKGEILVFQKRSLAKKTHQDVEGQSLREKLESPAQEKSWDSQSRQNSDIVPGALLAQATFLWENIGLEVPLKKKESKRILNDIHGWVKPRTLTALIGQTGAGKTSLLNALAGRIGVGTVDGYIGVDSKYKDHGFTQKIGYAQQQDLHLPTATVREALEFSALLRQPRKYSKQEKIDYVNHVINLLDMESFVEAVIGVPGEGLNIGQRKLLTIGVELAARPELLLFLDEPTSGLDSDTAWFICRLLRRLANDGQAILCTIHQPSGMVFEMFDKLLVIADGKQVYFGDIGSQSKVLTGYFERGGAEPCGKDQNPAEWLLDNLNDRTGDWAETWQSSTERQTILQDISVMKAHLVPLGEDEDSAHKSDTSYAAPFPEQLQIVTKRVLLHDWRSPSFLWSKTFTTFFVAFINGVSVWQSRNSIQGLQNQLFSVFIFFTIFTNHQQLMLFRIIETRTLYEARERPSQTFSWKVFILSSVLADLPGQTCMGILTFLSWYYPLGWHRNGATGSVSERSGLTFFFVWMYMLWEQSFSQLLGSFSPDVPSAIALGQTLFILSLIFSGMLVSANALPKFWLFLYRASPMSYYVSGMIGTSMSGITVQCSADEISMLDPPTGQTCGDYLSSYLRSSGANLLNSEATSGCKVCSVGKTDGFLVSYNIYFSNRWRDLGITIVYVAANVGLAMLFYWLARVPKGAKGKKTK